MSDWADFDKFLASRCRAPNCTTETNVAVIRNRRRIPLCDKHRAEIAWAKGKALTTPAPNRYETISEAEHWYSTRILK
jgi:hypothetical protein